MLLETKKVTKIFGGLHANSDIDFSIDEGEIVAIIGPNGSGKTTFYNVLTGISPGTRGQIIFKGKSIEKMQPEAITRLGMARTFQNIRLFSELSVLDNVKIAFNMHINYSLPQAIFRVKQYFSEEDTVTREALELLKLFHLDAHANDLAKNLPYGAQRRLEIARALATKPKLLLLDEPAAGMNPQETKELMEMIQWLRDNFKIAILLIEHDMGLVMGVCERLYVLEYGFCIATGTPEEIKQNKAVIKAYLGGEVS